LRSLLPHNSTEFERQLEQVLQLQTQDLSPEIIRQIHDSDTCPVEFLPWLAFSENADAWNDDWSESIKRSVIANAATAHRRKGTRGGLIDALAAVDVELEIVEWWEHEPPSTPGTFEITVTLGAEAIVSQVYDDIARVVERNKRHSLHYVLTLEPALEPIHCFDVCACIHSITATRLFLGVFDG